MSIEMGTNILYTMEAETNLPDHVYPQWHTVWCHCPIYTNLNTDGTRVTNSEGYSTWTNPDTNEQEEARRVGGYFTAPAKLAESTGDVDTTKTEIWLKTVLIDQREQLESFIRFEHSLDEGEFKTE